MGTDFYGSFFSLICVNPCGSFHFLSLNPAVVMHSRKEAEKPRKFISLGSFSRISQSPASSTGHPQPKEPHARVDRLRDRAGQAVSGDRLAVHALEAFAAEFVRGEQVVVPPDPGRPAQPHGVVGRFDSQLQWLFLSFVAEGAADFAQEDILFRADRLGPRHPARGGTVKRSQADRKLEAGSPRLQPAPKNENLFPSTISIATKTNTSDTELKITYIPPFLAPLSVPPLRLLTRDM